MPTRHANPGSPLRPDRYASAPEYAEARGLPGNLVSMKAVHTGDRRFSSLLYFIQAFSQRAGGLRRFAKEFLDAYPERILKQAVHCEDFDTGRRWTEQRDQRDNVERFFPDFLTVFCTNPRCADVDSACAATHSLAYGAARDFPESSGAFFQDLTGALYDFQERYADRVRAGFVETSISRQVWESLDDCLTIGRRPGREKGPVFVLQGESGTGKTWAARAWAEMHLGEARFLTLSGAMNKTSLFTALSRALGLPASYAVTSTQMQGRVEDMLARSRLLLVIDEAHFLLPQYGRSASRPELLDWIDTALANCGVPVVLVTTPQFAVQVARIAERSGWNVNQLKTRARRYVKLPEKPSKEDVAKVAQSLLTGSSETVLSIAVNYAYSVKHPLPALADLAEDAQMIAEREGRKVVSKADMETALRGFAVPTAVAKEALSTPPAPRNRGGKRVKTGLRDAPAAGPQTQRDTGVEDINFDRRSGEAVLDLEAPDRRGVRSVGSVAVA